MSIKTFQDILNGKHTIRIHSERNNMGNTNSQNTPYKEVNKLNVFVPKQEHFFLQKPTLNNDNIHFLEVLDGLGFTPDDCVICGSIGCICHGMNHSNTDVDITTTQKKFNQLLESCLIHKQCDNGQKVFYTDSQERVDICVPKTNTSYSDRPWEWCMDHSMVMNINGSNYRIANLEYLLHIYSLCMELHPCEKHKQRVEWLSEQMVIRNRFGFGWQGISNGR